MKNLRWIGTLAVGLTLERFSARDFSTQIKPDEAMLHNAIEDESIFGPITTVADSLVVCAQVRTNDDDEQPQSDAVMDVRRRISCC